MERLRALLFEPVPLDSPPEVLFLFGPPDVGKSSLPERMLGRAVCRVRTPQGSDIFRVDGYDPRVHQGILIEEFVDQIPIDQCKLICGLQVR